MKKLLLRTFILGSSIATLHAQSFFTTPTAQYLTPNWRGTSGTEYSHWDVFYSPNEGINYPDIEAPNGIGQLASEAGFTPPANASPIDPYAYWHLSNPTFRQTVPGVAFIIGPGTAGNIYSFSAAMDYELADTTPYTAGSVVMQYQTDGTLIDTDTIKLVAGGIEYAPTNFITEYKASGSSFGGLQNRTAAQWNLTGLGITDYTITFSSGGSSNSFQEFLLDTTPTYSEAVPSARTWTATSGTWSNAANWSTAAIPSIGGNVVVTGGTSMTVDGGTRTVGELKLTTPGAFTIGSSSGGVLKLNTGIMAEPTSPSTYTINTPVEIGAFNLTFLNANTTLDFNQPISGTTGMYFFGAGKMRLNANNTFAGTLTLDGGTLEISGANSYSGSTTVFGGALVVKANAPSGSAGPLGNASTAIAIGSGGTFGEPEAALLIDGAFTVGRGVTLSAGADPKKLGGRNTGAGATFGGAVTLNSTASGVRFSAENASDKVTFTGAITGGGAAGTVAKTGAGRVVYAGGTSKNYINATNVEAGTLEIASGTSFSGNGAMTVSAGASLIVHGTLSGSGMLSANAGTIGGSGTISRALLLDGGDTLAPGASVGALATVAQTWADGGRFQLELTDGNSTPGLGWDVVNITGALNLAASNEDFTLVLQTLGVGGSVGLMQDFNPAQNYSWKFAGASSGIANFAESDFTIDTTGFQNSLSGGSFSVAQNGNDLVLQFQAIPEPSTALLSAFGALGFLARRRRNGMRQ